MMSTGSDSSGAGCASGPFIGRFRDEVLAGAQVRHTAQIGQRGVVQRRRRRGAAVGQHGDVVIPHVRVAVLATPPLVTMPQMATCSMPARRSTQSSCVLKKAE